MAKVIIGIHGLANKPPKGRLTEWWKQSIIEGLKKNAGVSNPNFKYQMVFWADLLYRNRLHDEEHFAFDALYNDQPYLEAEPAALKRYADRWYNPARGAARGLALRGIDKIRTSAGLEELTDRLLEKKLKDLAFYWDAKRKLKGRNGRMRRAGDVLDEDCKQALKKHAAAEIMLIAHSMGSIISYNVLRDLGRIATNKVQVSHYVTIGSPLGLQIVKERTRKTRWDKKVRTPSIVTERWVNFSDRKDPVASDTHLRDDYRPNKAGVRVEDDLVLNDYVGLDGKENHHKSYGYLRTPEMSELIAAFLEG